MSARDLRVVQRAAHLVAGAIILIYVYTPFNDSTVGGLAAKLAAAPILLGSGVAMWQAARLRRLRRALANR